MIILDTNVLSEPLKARPDHKVISWLDRQAKADLFTTVITQAEMYYGLHNLPDGQKKDRLETALLQLFKVELKGKILDIPDDAPMDFGVHVARVRKAHGREYVKDFDGLIGAIAMACGDCLVATRDVRPFEAMGVPFINPWEDAT